MNWEWYLTQLAMQAIEVLPWLVAGLAAVAVVSFSPLGRGLVRHLRARREEMGITEQMLCEMQELRKVLDEISERLTRDGKTELCGDIVSSDIYPHPHNDACLLSQAPAQFAWVASVQDPSVQHSARQGFGSHDDARLRDAWLGLAASPQMAAALS